LGTLNGVTFTAGSQGTIISHLSGETMSDNETSGVAIVDFLPEHAAAFRDLNLAWIEDGFSVEESDRRVLDDPETEIIEHGGFIFVATAGGEIAGVCALIPSGPRLYQLAKMAVSPAIRGKGIGRRLAYAAIDRARDEGAVAVELFTNTVLVPAMGLYNSLGFKPAPFERAEHTRSNIRMVLEIVAPDAGDSAR
jgi:GNAT superfamily N-acetyltransferase